MKKQTEEKLEDIHLYSGIIALFVFIFAIIWAAGMHDDYGSFFGGNEIERNVAIGVLIALGVSVLIWIVTGIILKKEQGDLFVSFVDIAEMFLYIIFPIGKIGKNEVKKLVGHVGVPEEVYASALWKASTKGIRIFPLLASIFLFAFTGGCVWAIISAWMESSGDKWEVTVTAGLIGIICLFWCISCAMSAKNRPNDLIEYMSLHGVKFKAANEDFENAKRFGSEIYLGQQYLFIKAHGGMQIVARKDIEECQVNKMSGWSPRTLFLGYHVLVIEAKEDSIVKYGIVPIAFYQLKKSLEEGI